METIRIGVVGLCIRSRDRSVLMAKHRRTINQASWGLPGGGVELGELPHDAMQREWHEELGVPLTSTDLIAISHRADPNQTSILYVFQVACDWRQMSIDGDEVLGYGWISPKRLRVLRGRQQLISSRDAFLVDYILRGGPLSVIPATEYQAPGDIYRGLKRTAFYVGGYQDMSPKAPTSP
ncbi:NUDIX domain-containing protein [Sulfobacillus harzensis]|uniref:NUDIX hydrolase n=1 Tax=Sulfobacillus harzensis TaxID=2729629 RepID=A0A7Y0Q130_9FIRM|nr:NUDIX hydrolase [Sulfobacillus harzensis]